MTTTLTERPLTREFFPPPRFPGVFDADLAGLIAYVYVPYREAGSQCGKVRPVVLVSIDDAYVYVRPLYSGPRSAGGVRAVELKALRKAGLRRNGFAAEETLRVRRSDFRAIGRLTVTDWNRLRLGAGWGWDS